jgi:anti-sigma B factor antagonist
VSEPSYVIDADPVAGRLRVSGDLDINARADLQSAILSAVEGGHDVEVDLGAVTFLDSEGMAALIEGYNAATAAGTGFRVVHASGVVLQVLSVSGVLELFERR